MSGTSATTSDTEIVRNLHQPEGWHRIYGTRHLAKGEVEKVDLPISAQIEPTEVQKEVS